MRLARGSVSVAVGLATVLAGSASAQGGGGSIQCGDTITTSTRLTHDLSCPGTEAPALQVVGSGVVLDLGGHTVRRVGSETGLSEGIRVLADSTVRNGTIRGFNRGYVLGDESLPSPSQVGLSRLTFIDNGVAVYNRSGNTTLFSITDCRLVGNGSGLGSEQDASRGTFQVRSTLFFGNRLALSANSHSVDVVDSTFSHNETVVWCPDGSVSFTSSRLLLNTVVGDIRLGEFGYGFCRVVSFVDTVLARNGSLAPSNQSAWEPFDLVLRDSRVVGNTTGLMVRARTVDIQGNTWWGNEGGLILADLPEYVPPELTGTVSGNRFLSNRDDGLRVLVPSTLTVSRNAAIDNSGWGIHAPGVIDGGGNVARGNDAGDCVGVVCTSR
ncbi:right-handed parallel beta-helix repeat-containing protein [Archangium violaceum]|uniref:right-handed parallel beta-helix repeat-containing protein n=1 Tax=Archangium violaceum TaxID=83451 RepID=UPI00193B391A|nr:right-handed parallel beta-helix repeat-containing protein [Archangium violaceum]QRK09331.1 right-handed parallel beta-helix repeat-containing protein [Archangium violaceum]